MTSNNFLFGLIYFHRDYFEKCVILNHLFSFPQVKYNFFLENAFKIAKNTGKTSSIEAEFGFCRRLLLNPYASWNVYFPQSQSG